MACGGGGARSEGLQTLLSRCAPRSGVDFILQHRTAHHKLRNTNT